MSGEELGSDGCTDCEYVSLTERARGVLYATSNLKLWMACRRSSPLTKLCEFVKSELASKAKLSIEHWCHVARVEEETVTTNPLGIFRIVLEVLGIKYINEIRTTHSTAWVT